MAGAKKLEKLQRQFFWGDTIGKKRLHLIKWENITKKKEAGGLGVRRLLQQNLALLAKWWWRFSKDNESLWVKVVRSKYKLDQRSWLPEYPTKGSVSTVWNDICAVGDPSSGIGGIVKEGFKIKVYSGNNTYFWNHNWLGPYTLKEEFPRLFLLSSQKDEVISNIWGGLEDGSWGLNFKRRLQDRENQQLGALIQRLQSYAMDPSKP